MKWNHGDANGDGVSEELSGLTKRRKQEAKMFTQDPSPKPPQLDEEASSNP